MRESDETGWSDAGRVCNRKSESCIAVAKTNLAMSFSEAGVYMLGLLVIMSSCELNPSEWNWIG